MSYFLNSTTFYYLKLASHAALLGWSGPKDPLFVIDIPTNKALSASITLNSKSSRK